MLDLYGDIDLNDPLADHPLNDGRMLWLLGVPPLDGSRTWYDLCQRMPGVTLTNGPVWTTVGDYYPAVRFDGSNDYATATADHLNFEQTQAFWVECDLTLTTTTDNRWVVTRYSTSNAGWGLRRFSTDRLSLMLRSSVSSLLELTAPCDTARHHWVWTWDGNGSGSASGVRAWMDGAEISLTTASTSLGSNSIQSTGNFELGSRAGGGSNAACTIAGVSVGTGFPDAPALYDQWLRGYPDTLNRHRPATWFVGASPPPPPPAGAYLPLLAGVGW